MLTREDMISIFKMLLVSLWTLFLTAIPAGLILTIVWNLVLAPYFAVKIIYPWHGVLLAYLCYLLFCSDFQFVGVGNASKDNSREAPE